MIRPQPLKKGDTIAIVSPASAVANEAIVHECTRLIESWGYKVLFASHSLSRNGYYSGTPRERADDLTSLISDESVSALLCSYGGYGCIHIVEEFSTAIKERPKWIIGMSDCCVLHAACAKHGIMSLHSPQCRHLVEQPYGDAANVLRNILAGEREDISCAPNPLNRYGSASGTLIGGNLSILCSLLRTPYDILQPGIILFIEDVNEPAYRIERMIQTLKFSGVLSTIKGLIVGTFEGCRENPGLGGTIYELIHSIVSEYDIPLCFGFPVGHGVQNMPLIEGAQVQLIVDETGSLIRYI